MDKYIQEVVSQILTVASVEKMILFSKKLTLSGDTASFKLCLIVPDDSPTDLEHSIYIDVDSEVPFDVVVYTQSSWENAMEHPGSFAHNVNKTGSVIYGQTV